MKKLLWSLLSIGLYGPHLQKWQWEALQLVEEQNLAKPALIVIRNNTAAKVTFFEKWKNYPFSSALFRIWKRFFLRIDAQSLYPLPPFLKNIPIHYIRPNPISAYKEAFPNEDLDFMRSFHADFMIRFGFNILSGEVLHICPHGILSYHHGDEMEYRGGPPGFWEIFKGESKTAAIIQRLTEKLDAGPVLLKHQFITQHHSYAGQLNRLLMESTPMLAKAIRLIQQENTIPQKPKAIRRFPSNSQFLLFLFILLQNRFRFYHTKFLKMEKWNIALAQNGIFNPIETQLTPLISNKNGEYAADPFVWKDPSNAFVFYEHYSYASKKGSIRMLTIKDNKVQKTHTLLENETHFAYPFVFEHENKLYLAPENMESGKWSAYELNPHKAEIGERKTLIDLPLIDATLLLHNSMYYIFAGLPKQANEALHIWYSPNLWGPYKAHPLNPVVANPAEARMAGNFVQKDGQLFRPAQKCDRYYGEKIIWKKVDCLNPLSYSESTVGELNNTFNAKYPHGLHTFSQHQDLCVLDFKMHRSDFISLVSQAKSLLHVF